MENVKNLRLSVNRHRLPCVNCHDDNEVVSLLQNGLSFVSHIFKDVNMNKLLSALIVAAFATVSFSAMADDAAAPAAAPAAKAEAPAKHKKAHHHMAKKHHAAKKAKKEAKKDDAAAPAAK